MPVSSLSVGESSRILLSQCPSIALYPALLGPSRTLDLLLTGRTLGIEEAERLGIVTRRPFTLTWPWLTNCRAAKMVGTNFAR